MKNQAAIFLLKEVFAMGETDYNALLYDKMKDEQDKYRDWLLSQPPEEILNHTYEYTMREDIVVCMEELELSPKQAKALLRSPCPLADVYKEFMDREVEHIGNNINQLAIKANALGFVDSQMLKNEALRWHKFQAAIEREFLRPEKSGLKWQ